MAKFDRRSCRIYDGVRDSKIHWDTRSNFDRKIDSSKYGRAFPRSYEEDENTSFRRVGQRSQQSSTAWSDRRNTVREADKPYFRSILPTFDGSSSTLDFLDWIDCLQDYFDAMKPPDDLKCKLAASKLKGEAREWWEELQQHRFEEGKNLITSWPRMYKILINKFLHTSRLTYFYERENERDGNSSLNESLIDNRAEDSNKNYGLGEIHVNEQTKEIDEMMLTTCLIKVLSENTVYDNEIVKGQQVGEVIQGANNTLAAENYEKENIYDDLEEIDVEDHSKETVELESAACSIKFPLEADLNNNDEKKELRYLGVGVSGLIYSNSSRTLKTLAFSWPTMEGTMDRSLLDCSTNLIYQTYGKCSYLDYSALDFVLFLFDPGGVPGPQKFRSDVNIRDEVEVPAGMVKEESIYVPCVSKDAEKCVIAAPISVYNGLITLGRSMLQPICSILTSALLIEFRTSISCYAVTGNVSFHFFPDGVQRLMAMEIFGNRHSFSSCIFLFYNIPLICVGTELMLTRILGCCMMLRADIAQRYVMCWCFWAGNALDHSLVSYPLKLSAALSLNYETLVSLEAFDVQYVDNSNLSGTWYLTSYLALVMDTYSVCRVDFKSEGHDRVAYQSLGAKDEIDLTIYVDFVSRLFDPGGSAEPHNFGDHLCDVPICMSLNDLKVCIAVNVWLPQEVFTALFEMMWASMILSMFMPRSFLLDSHYVGFGSQIAHFQLFLNLESCCRSGNEMVGGITSHDDWWYHWYASVIIYIPAKDDTSCMSIDANKKSTCIGPTSVKCENNVMRIGSSEGDPHVVKVLVFLSYSGGTRYLPMCLLQHKGELKLKPSSLLNNENQPGLRANYDVHDLFGRLHDDKTRDSVHAFISFDPGGVTACHSILDIERLIIIALKEFKLTKVRFIGTNLKNDPCTTPWNVRPLCCVSYMLLYNFNFTRGRAKLLEGWNDVNNSSMCIMAECNSVLVWPYLIILCENGQPMACVKLFSKTVNGPDPPIHMKAKMVCFDWILKGSLEDELFVWGDGLM